MPATICISSDAYQIPTIIFINKIDRAGVNLERLYMDIKTNLSQDVLFP